MLDNTEVDSANDLFPRSQCEFETDRAPISEIIHFMDGATAKIGKQVLGSEALDREGVSCGAMANNSSSHLGHQLLVRIRNNVSSHFGTNTLYGRGEGEQLQTSIGFGSPGEIMDENELRRFRLQGLGGGDGQQIQSWKIELSFGK